MDVDVIYKENRLRLTRFWGNQKPCLWIKNPSQRNIPKMQFVGGYPNEYCIFLEDLTEEEIAQIKLLDGSPLDLKTWLKQTQ